MTDIILGVLHMCIFPGGLFALAVGLLFKALTVASRPACSAAWARR